MTLAYMKALVVTISVLGMAAIAFSLDVSSVRGWAILVGLGLLPPVVMFRVWQVPAQTTSESIREALR